MKKTKNILILIIIVIAAYFLISAYTTPQTKKITEITLPDQPNTVYTFSSDVRDALRYPASSTDNIRYVLFNSNKINIVFNGTSAEDDTYFYTVIFNTIWKMQQFFVNNGKLVDFQQFYFINGTWYVSANETTVKPNITGPIIWIRGPNTGALNNSIELINNTIFLQGTTYGNLTLAGDKLALITLGVDDLKQVYYA
ncbi:MAG: hypothetical protein NT120_03805 [Candidatus Aenigmarchaeota archaeon]|nr:hypothetical protein [Candidatus Aenigmarchaeota archaeon]